MSETLANWHPTQEQTFLMVKPDGVMRGLVGEIIRRVEQRGLKVVAIVMELPTRDKIDNHYPKDTAWIERLGGKTIDTYQKYNYDLKGDLGTTDAKEIGQMVRGWLLESMTSGPVVKMVIQGLHAVDAVRKMVGATIPYKAELGSIRGDYSVDSPALANKEHRAVFNLVHASETPEEATHEIGYWFDKKDIHTYQRTEDPLFGNR